jgi:putative colanic acid biosynthesis acetyltransferase WcaF
MRKLSRFRADYDRGRSIRIRLVWLAVKFPLTYSFYGTSKTRTFLLKVFGANISDGLVIRHHVDIQWPWKLSVGSNTWIGEGTRIITLEDVTIGSNVCISQEVLICTGSHDYLRADFAYKNRPIVINDGAWLAARCLILPGVTVGKNSVVAAGEVLRIDLPDNHMFIHGEIRPIPEPS